MAQVKAGNTSAIIYASKAILKMSDNPVDEEERKLKLQILRAQAENGGAEPGSGRQVIIINDTKKDDAGDEPGADPDQ